MADGPPEQSLDERRSVNPTEYLSGLPSVVPPSSNHPRSEISAQSHPHSGSGVSRPFSSSESSSAPDPARRRAVLVELTEEKLRPVNIVQRSAYGIEPPAAFSEGLGLGPLSHLTQLPHHQMDSSPSHPPSAVPASVSASVRPVSGRGRIGSSTTSVRRNGSPDTRRKDNGIRFVVTGESGREMMPGGGKVRSVRYVPDDGNGESRASASAGVGASRRLRRSQYPIMAIGSGAGGGGGEEELLRGIEDDDEFRVPAVPRTGGLQMTAPRTILDLLPRPEEEEDSAPPTMSVPPLPPLPQVPVVPVPVPHYPTQRQRQQQQQRRALPRARPDLRIDVMPQQQQEQSGQSRLSTRDRVELTPLPPRDQIASMIRSHPNPHMHMMSGGGAGLLPDPDIDIEMGMEFESFGGRGRGRERGGRGRGRQRQRRGAPGSRSTVAVPMVRPPPPVAPPRAGSQRLAARGPVRVPPPPTAVPGAAAAAAAAAAAGRMTPATPPTGPSGYDPSIAAPGGPAVLPPFPPPAAGPQRRPEAQPQPPSFAGPGRGPVTGTGTGTGRVTVQFHPPAPAPDRVPSQQQERGFVGQRSQVSQLQQQTQMQVVFKPPPPAPGQRVAGPFRVPWLPPRTQTQSQSRPEPVSARLSAPAGPRVFSAPMNMSAFDNPRMTTTTTAMPIAPLAHTSKVDGPSSSSLLTGNDFSGVSFGDDGLLDRPLSGGPIRIKLPSQQAQLSLPDLPLMRRNRTDDVFREGTPDLGVDSVIAVVGDSAAGGVAFDPSERLSLRSDPRYPDRYFPWVPSETVLQTSVLVAGKFVRMYSLSQPAVALCSPHVPRTQIEFVRAMALLPDHRIAIGSAATIFIWEFEEKRVIRRLDGHEGSVRAIVYLGEDLLATCAWDKTIKIWNFEAGKLLRSLEGHSGNVQGICLVGREFLVSASEDFSVRVWNWCTGQCVLVLGKVERTNLTEGGVLVPRNQKGESNGHEGFVNCVVSLGDAFVATGSADGTIKTWDIQEGACVSTLRCHHTDRDKKKCSLYCICVVPIPFDPAREKSNRARLQSSRVRLGARRLPPVWLLSGSQDKTVRLWDVREGSVIRTFVGHGAEVVALVLVTPLTFASGGNDRLVRIWNLKDGRLLKVIPNQGDWVKCMLVVRQKSENLIAPLQVHEKRRVEWILNKEKENENDEPRHLFLRLEARFRNCKLLLPKSLMLVGVGDRDRDLAASVLTDDCDGSAGVEYLDFTNLSFEGTNLILLYALYGLDSLLENRRARLMLIDLFVFFKATKNVAGMFVTLKKLENVVSLRVLLRLFRACVHRFGETGFRGTQQIGLGGVGLPNSTATTTTTEVIDVKFKSVFTLKVFNCLHRRLHEIAASPVFVRFLQFFEAWNSLRMYVEKYETNHEDFQSLPSLSVRHVKTPTFREIFALSLHLLSETKEYACLKLSASDSDYVVQVHPEILAVRSKMFCRLLESYKLDSEGNGQLELEGSSSTETELRLLCEFFYRGVLPPNTHTEDLPSVFRTLLRAGDNDEFGLELGLMQVITDVMRQRFDENRFEMTLLELGTFVDELREPVKEKFLTMWFMRFGVPKIVMRNLLLFACRVEKIVEENAVMRDELSLEEGEPNPSALPETDEFGVMADTRMLQLRSNLARENLNLDVEVPTPGPSLEMLDLTVKKPPSLPEGANAGGWEIPDEPEPEAPLYVATMDEMGSMLDDSFG